MFRLLTILPIPESQSGKGLLTTLSSVQNSNHDTGRCQSVLLEDYPARTCGSMLTSTNEPTHSWDVSHSAEFSVSIKTKKELLHTLHIWGGFRKAKLCREYKGAQGL